MKNRLGALLCRGSTNTYQYISTLYSTPYTFFLLFFFTSLPSSLRKTEFDLKRSLLRFSVDEHQGFFFPLGVNVNTLAIRGTVSVYTVWDTAPQREELNLCFLDRTEYVLWKPWELPQDHILSFKLSRGRFWMVGEAQAHMLNVVESKGQPNWD